MNFLNLTLILFLIMDSFGNVNTSLSLLEKTPSAKRSKIILREMMIALSVMILFNYIGEFIFSILSVSEITIRLASGAILFLVAIKTLFPALDSPRANLPQGEPFITPLAIPLTASPALLATIMLFAHIEPAQFTMLAAILIAWAASTFVLLGGETLKKWMGTNGLIACEKLMGMILVMLAIQRFLEGLQQFAELCSK